MMNKFNNEEYVGVGIFAGAGGLDTGLMNGGINMRLAIDFEPAACKTYQLNHPNTVVWNRDVCTVTGEEIRNVKGIGNKKIILAGGPPCQSWSEFKEEISNSRKGLDDVRGQMIYQYLRIVEELKPVAIVFENVPYMVTNPKHLVEFEKFKAELGERTGLNLEYQILKSINYGQAQLRERVIMIGTVKGIPNPFNYLRDIEGPKTLREALQNCPSSDYFKFRKTDKEVMKQIKAGQCWNALSPEVAYAHMRKDYKGICLDCGNNFEGVNKCPKCHSTHIRNGYGITSYLRRLSFDKPSPTICAVPTNKTHGLLGHPTEQRALSIRECARLQGFADSYEFVGTIFEQQKQIGNAVSVGVGKAIGLAIIEAINNSDNNFSNEDLDYNVMFNKFKFIVMHPNRFILSELEKDFIRLAFKRYQENKPFPSKYQTYFDEMIVKINNQSKNVAM